jgi:hypothetical protein
MEESIQHKSRDAGQLEEIVEGLRCVYEADLLQAAASAFYSTGSLQYMASVLTDAGYDTPAGYVGDLKSWIDDHQHRVVERGQLIHAAQTELESWAGS